MSYKTGNPALTNKTFIGLEKSSEPMTLESTAKKTLLLLLLCITAGVAGWQVAGTQLAKTDQPLFVMVFLICTVGAFATSILTIFRKRIAKFTAPLYAVFEGFLLGWISYWFEIQYSGIVLQAVLITASIFLAMLMIYLTGIIKVTENFKLMLASITGGIAVYYFANLIVNFAGKELPLINSNSVYGILFSVFVIIIAALNLVWDFDFIEQGVKNKAPKYMEWYAGFGLLVTVIWLYIEILRALGKAKSR